VIIKTEEYTIDIMEGHGKTLFSGSMRLPSPTAYEESFSKITAELDNTSTTYELDLKELNFLNSSGLTAIARLFIYSRKKNKAIRVIGSADIPWQKRSLPSLKKLWEKIDIQIV